MHRLHCLVAIVLFGGIAVRAQEPADQPPKLGQPADFSGLVGAFQIKAQAKPTAVAVEEPITLTVTITGRAVGTHAPKRENLRIFADGVSRDFFIEPGADKAADGVWEFVYHLRPKHQPVQFVPGLKLVYYAPRQRRYQSAYADAIPLTVQMRREPVVEIKGLKVIQAPTSFFELAEKDTTDWGFPAGHMMIGGLKFFWRWLLVPPLLCAPAAWWWRRQRRKLGDLKRRQRRLFDQTVAALSKPTSDAASITRLLTIYLRQRLDFPAVELTPVEVERWLKRRGVAKPVRQQWRELLQGYDARRFAPGFGERTEMDGREAVEMIQLLEDEACLACR